MAADAIGWLSSPGLGRCVFEKQVEDEQLSVEVSLHPQAVAVSKVFAFEIDLQPLDCALDASAHLVTGPVSGKVLRMVPVYLRKVIAADPDVPPCASNL